MVDPVISNHVVSVRVWLIVVKYNIKFVYIIYIYRYIFNMLITENILIYLILLFK